MSQNVNTLDERLDIHQQMDDEPNDAGGLSAEELKEKFDFAALALQKYLNEVLVPAHNRLGVDVDELARVLRDHTDIDPGNITAQNVGLLRELADKYGLTDKVAPTVHDALAVLERWATLQPETAALFGLGEGALLDDAAKYVGIGGFDGDLMIVREEITESGTWTAPEDITGEVTAFVFGGGGGGAGGGGLNSDAPGGGGGGGGHLAIGRERVAPGELVSVVVGRGGAGGKGGYDDVETSEEILATDGGAGEASRFGSISADGGGGGKAATATEGPHGGDGGTGGGGGQRNRGNGPYCKISGRGGHGSYGGGGGGGGGHSPGGNGGVFGGGGGAGGGSSYSGDPGLAGAHGGRGGTSLESAGNGGPLCGLTNIEQLALLCAAGFGAPGAGGGGLGGGGGCASAGGKSHYYKNSAYSDWAGGAGGGLFGASGGGGYNAGGGGGGFGANGNGGLGYYDGSDPDSCAGGGGGGGYGPGGTGGKGGVSNWEAVGGSGGLAAGGGGGSGGSNVGARWTGSAGGDGGNGVVILVYHRRARLFDSLDKAPGSYDANEEGTE